MEVTLGASTAAGSEGASTGLTEGRFMGEKNLEKKKSPEIAVYATAEGDARESRKHGDFKRWSAKLANTHDDSLRSQSAGIPLLTAGRAPSLATSPPSIHGRPIRHVAPPPPVRITLVAALTLVASCVLAAGGTPGPMQVARLFLGLPVSGIGQSTTIRAA